MAGFVAVLVILIAVLVIARLARSAHRTTKSLGQWNREQTPPEEMDENPNGGAGEG